MMSLEKTNYSGFQPSAFSTLSSLLKNFSRCSSRNFFASGSNTFKRFSLISVVWCCSHSCHACLETFSKNSWPLAQSLILPFPFDIYGKILVDSFCILKRITVLDVYGHGQSQLQPVLVKFRQYDHVHLPKLLVSKLYQIHLL